MWTSSVHSKFLKFSVHNKQFDLELICRMNGHDQLTLSTHTYRAGWDLGLLLQIWALMTQWFSWLESWSRDSFFKVLVLVFWLFFGHKLSISKWRQTFVGRGRHRALFTNLCCVLIVESLNGDQLHMYILIIISNNNNNSRICKAPYAKLQRR